MPNVSIVIPTYNRLEQLKLVLFALEQQDFPLKELEVVVVSDGSKDGTDAFLRSFEPAYCLRFFSQENQGVAAARNLGIQHARGEIVIFIDDDVVPSPQLVSAHMCTHHEKGENAVVLGPMLTPEGYPMHPWVQWEQAMLYKQYDAMSSGKHAPTARQFFTGNTSLARRHLLASGGFDRRFRRAEDVELAYRLADQGIQFFFNPTAKGYHYAERSYKSWVTIPYVYGRSDVIFNNEKQQRWLLPTIWQEYYSRHPFTRALTKICLDRQLLSKASLRVLKSCMILFNKIGWTQGTTVICSSIFNLRYYQGIADELGGRASFFEGLRQMGNQIQEPAPSLQA